MTTPESGPGAAAQTVRSEERASVRVETVPVERVRVRRTIISEEQTITVTVRKEVLVVERTPVSDGQVGEHRIGSDVVVVLHEERPVVTMEVVPVERVTLRRSTVTTEQQLTTDLRAERVQVVTTPDGAP